MGHITVACLNFNGLDSLKESIASVLAQTLKPDRFVVIDNASTDSSRQIGVDMGVEIVDADNKHQFITGLNAALELNQDKLFFMQNDVVLDKDCLKNMIRDCPVYNFIAQPVIYQTNREIDNAGMDYYWPGFGLRRHSNWWGDYNWRNCGLVTTICFMTDVKYVSFDTQFSPAYYEDIDWYLRTKSTVSHILISSGKAIHRGNHTFSQTFKKRQISDICHRHRVKLINKHYKGIDRLIRLTVTASFYVMKKSFDVVRDRWVSYNNRK